MERKKKGKGVKKIGKKRHTEGRGETWHFIFLLSVKDKWRNFKTYIPCNKLFDETY